MIGPYFRFDYHQNQNFKKPRGVKRKALLILKESMSFAPDLGSEDWFQFEHVHLDWDGIGDCGAKIRLITMEAHANIFRKYADQGVRLKKPFQLFFSLPKADAGQDAVYIHTPNPHSNYPAVFDDVSWGIPHLEAIFMAWLSGFDIVAGSRDFNYVLYAEGIGESLKMTTPKVTKTEQATGDNA